MAQQLVAYKRQLDAMLATRMGFAAADWLAYARTEIAGLANAASEEGLPEPSSEVLNWADSIVILSARVGVAEPSISHDDAGGIEIFVKGHDAALLLVVKPDGTLQVFADSDREQWRARYLLAGTAWSRYLRNYLDDLKFGRA